MTTVTNQISAPHDSPGAPHPLPAVRAIITDPQGRVLLLQRAETSYGLGCWCLPGGKVDCGQSAEEALKAELTEELAVRLDQATYLFSQDSPPERLGGPHFLNLYFHCRVSGDIRLNAESSALAWADPAELAEYVIVFGNAEAIARFYAATPQPQPAPEAAAHARRPR